MLHDLWETSIYPICLSIIAASLKTLHMPRKRIGFQAVDFVLVRLW